MDQQSKIDEYRLPFLIFELHLCKQLPFIINIQQGSPLQYQPLNSIQLIQPKFGLPRALFVYLNSSFLMTFNLFKCLRCLDYNIIFFLSKIMSLFLLPLSFNSIPKQIPQQRISTIIQQKEYQISQVQGCNLQRLIGESMKVLPQWFYQDQSQGRWVFVIDSIWLTYKTLLHVSFSKSQSKLYFSLSILNNQQSFLKIANSERLLEMLKLINHYASSHAFHICKTTINTHNRQINIQLPFLLLSNSSIRTHLHSIFKFCRSTLFPLLRFILSCSNEIQSDIKYLQGTDVNKLAQLNKYSHLLHVPIHLSNQQLDHQVINKAVGKVIKQMIQEQECFKLPYQLIVKSSYFTSPNYHLSQQQLRQIHQSILVKPNNNKQLILNQICVNNMEGLQLKKVNEGGFCSIFTAEIAYSTTLLQSNRFMDHQSPCKKIVVFKNGNGKEGLISNEREFKIIKTLQNVATKFLPKYYLIANRPNPYSKSIVMDYISSSNLKDYLHLNSKWLSLRTKLWLIRNITESLRFLQSNRIVHLDLKPNNIMVSSDLTVKLIDFGQSYHHEVCSKGKFNLPGYTIPYSPPQIFNNDPKQFTSKSDVFSLGVIMFQILYRSYPFQIFESTAKIDDAMQAFEKKFFLCSQALQTFGDVHIMRILNLVICKCLSFVEEARPQLNWIAFTIGQCIEILK